MAVINEEEIMEALHECYDPEIPVNIVDLGLVYNVDVNDDEGSILVTMTLTSLGCPMAGEVISEVEMRVGQVEHVKSCKVDLTYDPPWSPDRMTEDAKWELAASQRPGSRDRLLGTLTSDNMFGRRTSS